MSTLNIMHSLVTKMWTCPCAKCNWFWCMGAIRPNVLPDATSD